MSKILPTNSPLRSPTTTNDFGAVDPSLGADQQQNTIFSSEIFDPGTSSVAASDVTGASEGVGTVIQPVDSQTLETELESQLAQLDGRFNQFSEQLHKLDANFKLINARLDSLESQPNSTAEPDAVALASTIETRFESLESIFKAQCEMVNGFFANATTGTDDAKVKINTAPVVEAESTLESTTAPATEAEPAATEEAPAATEEAPVVSETAPAVTEEANIEELKRQLKSKIREAEVEMSINRARLMQERVEHERVQADLERRAATLEAKLAASTGDDNENSTEENNIMGRFKRHLGNNN